jgi:hypothetical protein
VLCLFIIFVRFGPCLRRGVLPVSPVRRFGG